MVNDTRAQAPRDRATTQLRKERDFRGHLLVYVLVNAFLVAIWAVTDIQGFFWPVFVIGGWGIGLVMNAWDVYWRHEITEEDVQREMELSIRRSQNSATLPLPGLAGTKDAQVSSGPMKSQGTGYRASGRLFAGHHAAHAGRSFRAVTC